MKSNQFRVPLYGSMKIVMFSYLFWGIGGVIAYSQDTPVPPIPHARPVLPGTHVMPQPVVQKSDVVLHIDGPATAEQKQCTQHTFALKYSVINHSTEPASGTIRATFNGISLTAVGSAKLNNLGPGKAANGAFTACCPSRGSFTASMEYRDDSSSTQNKGTGHLHYASDSLNISCR